MTVLGSGSVAVGNWVTDTIERYNQRNRGTLDKTYAVGAIRRERNHWKSLYLV